MRTRLLTFAIAGVAVAALVPGQALAQGFGFAFMSAQRSPTAGKALTVKARISILDPVAARTACRLVLREPSGRMRRVRGVRRFNGESARIGWRTRLAVTAPAGSWRAQIFCSGGARIRDEISVEVKPARRAARVSEIQLVDDIGSTDPSYFAWSARVTNPFGFEIQEGDMTVVLRDAAGRIVSTRTYSDAITLSAGQSAVVGAEVVVEGETPASIQVRVVGDVHRRQFRPTEIRDLRVVVIPSDYGKPEVVVRGEAVNGSPREISPEYMFVTTFDQAGRLVSAVAEFYPGRIAAGQSRGIDQRIGFGDALAASAWRAEAFYPAIP